MQQPPNPEQGRDTTPRKGSNNTLPSTQTNTGTLTAPPPGLTLLHTLQGHTKWVGSVAWSSDGSRLASGSEDQTVHVWDVSSGRLLHSLQGHTSAVESVAWSPDGSRLASASDDHTVRVWDAASGHLLHSLQGHTNAVITVAWSPDGSRLASGSSDQAVRVWDATSGRLLHTLHGHTNAVRSVAWSPDGSRLASGSSDQAVRVWDVASGHLLHSLKDPTTSVRSVAWSPDGSRLASAAAATVRMWDASSGHLLHTLQGHTDWVRSVAWSPAGSRLASASDDQTVRVWDVASGHLLHSLQGHTNEIWSVAWSPDGSLLASASPASSPNYGEVRIWRTDTWEPIVVLTGRTNTALVAWHPHVARLVTAGWFPQDIVLWQLDLAYLLQQAPSAETVHYKTAKVVLVGESGVGKSGLALVLTKQPFVATVSTHGRHIWPLDELEATLDNGQRERRETWLWDLAGQRDYRIIHQLHLHEATVALIVFDPARDTDPLAGIRYWQRALHLAQQARGSSALPLTIFLVAARMDRGGRGVSRERITALMQELGCAGYLETSALTGLGMAELGQTIRAALNWEHLPGVTSTKLLHEIKTSVLGEVQAGHLLRTVDELYLSFLHAPHTSTSGETLRHQFEMALRHLEAQGVLRWLSFGNLVLLQSERLDAYASALLIAVRNEPDELGMIAEERVRQGQFAIPDEERIGTPTQEQLLLLAMIEELVRHEIVLREGGSLLFPSQSTREHPGLAQLLEQQSVTFRFAGPVLSIYTMLVVRLAQSDIFQKQELWQHVVTYKTRLGGSFGLVLIPRGEEQAELGLFFDEAAREEMRFLFEDFVQRHLHRHASGSVQRRRHFVCPTCGELFTEQQVSNRRARGFTAIRCTCDADVSLLDGEERLSAPIASQVQAMEQQADAKRDQQSATTIVAGKRATRDFDVFLCHNGQDKQAVKQLGEQLQQRGILPWLDEWELRPGLPWQQTLEEQIDKIKTVAVFVGSSGIGPWQQRELEGFLRAFVNRGCPVIPVLLPNAPQEPKLPVFLQAFTWVDFRIQDPDPLQRLRWGITGKREREQGMPRGIR